MKKLIIFVMLGIITVSCSINKVNTDYISYNGLEFRIRYLRKSVTSGDQNYSYITTDSGRFIRIEYQFRNNTTEAIEFDFNEITLLDNEGNEYHPSTSFKNGGQDGPNMIYTLKAGKSKIYSVGYLPTFPKDEDLKRIKINGKVIDISNMIASKKTK